MNKKCLFMPWVHPLIGCYQHFAQLLECLILPLLLLWMRFWMGRIFFRSGLVKISNWEGTVFLFEHEYQVPLLPPEFAAYCATTFELICPVLLVFGILTRLGTLPMLAMTAIIEFTYLSMDEHVYWAMLLGMILCYGPGPLSIDAWIQRKYRSCHELEWKRTL